jgi:hypothetical protein
MTSVSCLRADDSVLLSVVIELGEVGYIATDRCVDVFTVMDTVVMRGDITCSEHLIPSFDRGDVSIFECFLDDFLGREEIIDTVIFFEKRLEIFPSCLDRIFESLYDTITKKWKLCLILLLSRLIICLDQREVGLLVFLEWESD